MTADRSPQPAAGHVGRRASDYVRLDDLLGQAFDEIEQMGGEPPVEARYPFVLPASTLHDLAQVRDNLDALAHLVGAGAVETTRRLVADLHEQAARNEDHLHRIARELAAAKRHLTTAISEREHARGVACRLEEEIARDQGGEWLVTYVALLERQVGPDAIDVLASRASRQVAEAAARVVRGPAQVVGDVTIRLVDAGLPVIDDATLGERELVFRRDGDVVAVGRLDRLFRPLDTANEIALGAAEAGGPPDGETVDVFGAGIGEEWLWPDSVLWQRPTELRPTWLLTEAEPAKFVMVARPTCAEGASRSDIRRVDVGQEWACPACTEAPVPHPVRPPGEHPSGYIDVDVDPDVLTWPDLTTWRRRLVEGAEIAEWTLLASPRPDHSVFVAPPRGRGDMEPCRVEVGQKWSYRDESPYPVPPGPVDPPRPPHHQPFA